MKPNPDISTRTPHAPARSYRVVHAMMGPMMKVLGLSCRHFSELCTARQDRSLTFLENFRYRLHGIICALCRPLPGQFENLNRLARQAEGKDEAEPASPAILDPSACDRIHDALVDEKEAAQDTPPG